MKNLLFTLCVCIALGKLCNAQEFPASYGMYDIYFSEDASSISRDFVLHEKVNFIAPNYLTTLYYECYDSDSQEFESLFGDIVFTLIVDQVSYEMGPNEQLEIILSKGDYEIAAGYTFAETDCDQDVFNYFNIQVRQSEQSYQAPDDVWEISLDQEFQPPISSPYPANSVWAKYNENSIGKAIATIKLGEGNSVLTRPIIFVDGIDFGEYTVKDPNIDKIIRYGSTGWENVCQGLLSKKTEVGELELFENYPSIINDLLTKQDDLGEDNYDIILVEFEDGADYIQKNALLLKKVIESVNLQKKCGYENLILGLSMGGQVSRFALRYMEEEGIDHQCRQYISFDSPHIYANIPLSVQAFVYAGAHFLSNETALENWYGLNRPAAIQMLKYNLMGEITKGTIHYSHENYSYTMDASNLVEEHLENIPFKAILPKANELRGQFVAERTQLGFPSQAEKLCIANGSGNGTTLFNSEILAHLKNESQDIIWNPLTGFGQLIIDYIIENNEDELFKIKLNAVGTDQENIFEFNFFDMENFEFNKVRLSNNNSLWKVDNAPGCSRDDLKAIIYELELLKENEATSVEGWSGLFLDFDLELYEKVRKSTFMPTASVVGFSTDNLLLNLEYEYENKSLNTPFDFIHLPLGNEPHVYANPGNESFLLSHVNDNIWNYGEDIILPNDTLGYTYNFGFLRSRLHNFTLNKGGRLNINKAGPTGFIESFPEDLSRKDFFSCATINSNCYGASNITINKGGKLTIGDENNASKSGSLTVVNGGELSVKGGAELMLENSSQLIISPAANLIIESNGTLELIGQESELVIAGTFKTTGDITIVCNGKISIHETAQFILGGQLTIIGDNIEDELMVLEAGCQTEISNNFILKNGTLGFKGQSSLNFIESELVDFQNIRIGSNNSLKESNYLRTLKVEEVNFEHIQVLKMPINENFPHTIDIEIQGSGGQETCNIINSTFKFCNKSLLIDSINSIFIDHSTFENNIIGLEANHIQELVISGSIFQKQAPQLEDDLYNYQACTFSNISYLGFKDTDVKNYNTPLLSDLQLPAIALNNISLMKVQGGDFLGNYISLYAPKESSEGELSKNNIIIEEGASFKNNETGIYMEGGLDEEGFDYGLVKITCSSFVENLTGVKGIDVLLDIDNFTGLLQNQQNTFINYNGGTAFGFQPDYSGTIFDICYDQRMPQEIYGRGNYWGPKGFQEKYVEMLTCEGQSTIPFVAAPEMYNVAYCSQTPQGLAWDSQIENSLKCIVPLNGEAEEALHSIFRKGLEHLQIHNNDESNSSFKKLASMTNNERDQLLDGCKHFVDVSRIFEPKENTGISPLISKDLSIEKNALEANKNRLAEMNFKITPNPAHGIVYINSGDIKDAKVFIAGVNGEVMYSGKILNQQLVINIFNWNKGIYFVKYFNNKNDMIYQDKLIVQ